MFYKFFREFFHIHVQKCLIYQVLCQYYEKKIQRNDFKNVKEMYQKLSEEKKKKQNENMVANNTKIFQKMEKKKKLITIKHIIKSEKNKKLL